MTRPGDGSSAERGQEWLVALIDEGRPSSGARYRALAEGLRAAIVSGEVPPGTRLPPQRELADRLSVGRTTVVDAYNLLSADALLETRQGAGTWVARRPASARPPRRP